ncbi:MAG: HAD family hydrolase, partial [Elusimicrobiota bacterium]
MITKQLIERMFDAASMQRWNDHVRPMDFSELDKQAHKMIIAWMLARLEESAGR